MKKFICTCFLLSICFLIISCHLFFYKPARNTIEEIESDDFISSIKFDFDGAIAVAKLEANKSLNQDSDDKQEEFDTLVKIMADGTMQNVITYEGDNSDAADFLSNIKRIFRSTAEKSKDIYIVFYSYNSQLGQLICVHEDGSITDILKKKDTDVNKENEDNFDYEYSYNNYIKIRTDVITQDNHGNLFFVAYHIPLEGVSTGTSDGDAICKFSPDNNTVSIIVPPIKNVYYSEIQIDQTEQWVFASGSSSSYFIRAIPVSNPENYTNIYYSSDSYADENDWVYDDKVGKLYFSAEDGDLKGLFMATKAGGFKDKKLLKTEVTNCFEKNIFEGFRSSSEKKLDWLEKYLNDNQFNSELILTDILDEVVSTSYEKTTKNYLKLTTADVDIRFDKYASETGALKILALLTNGKKNADVFEALNNQIGKAALYTIYSSAKDFFEYDTQLVGYKHNFLADIIYVKDSNQLLIDSDKVIFSYIDRNGNQCAEKLADVLKKNPNGSFEKSGTQLFVKKNDETAETNFIISGLSSDFYNEGVLSPSSVLEYFFNYCNVYGTKEFKLDCFKNDTKYKSLYSSLTNESAVQWLFEDIGRMNLFIDSMGVHYSSSSTWNENKEFYVPFMNMLAKTCYLTGTNEKAISWNCDDSSISIPYYSTWNRNTPELLIVDESGLYYEYTNLGYKLWKSDKPYFYMIQVTDSAGKMIEIVNQISLPNGKMVQSTNTGNRIIMLYSILDENGAEQGFYYIYSFDLATGKITNCFENVPNKDSLEVTSFNCVGDTFYYSAVKGTSVQNGSVNLKTNEAGSLSVQRKMLAFYPLS